jgi:hypothetical protein
MDCAKLRTWEAVASNSARFAPALATVVDGAACHNRKRNADEHAHRRNYKPLTVKSAVGLQESDAPEFVAPAWDA